MALDYKKIRKDKKREYGTKVGNYGRLIANLYSDRAHFIFELLQNAEDALRERSSEWRGSRAVSFNLTKDMLKVNHCGRPFNEADVRGICEIGESAKADDLTAVGRFGIGFKSVYEITDRPGIHSGPEDFAIENYVLPKAVPSIQRGVDETVFLFPLKSNGESAYDDIATGLKSLRASSLLFLRQIEEVKWQIDDGPSGLYLQDSKHLEENVRKVTIIGQMLGEEDVSEDWLVFSRPVTIDEGHPAGQVEIAFFLDPANQSIRPVSDSRLVVFFPTTLATNLGFLMQGPYQTTPNRADVPSHVPWNKHLVNETSILLLQTLRWLRDKGDLTTGVIRCLPLKPKRFGINTGPFSGFLGASGNRFPVDANMFARLFNDTKQALTSEPLLPGLNSEFVSASRALLGRTKEIRQLFSPAQLSALYANNREMAWLSGDITQDRAPEIRDYLINELDVNELAPETITRRLGREFLEKQPDSWILKLYEFLFGQPAIIRMLLEGPSRSQGKILPLIRLTDGRHVSLGSPQAFLPSDNSTDFPTVRPAVCKTPKAIGFLHALGLREPDLVDDVIQNVLPKYQGVGHKPDDAEYERDITRILRAYATDSTAQRAKLVGKLRRSMFVKSIEPGTSRRYRSKPTQVYLATEKMRELFEGVNHVRIVDIRYNCLRGQQAQELLEACGTTSHLKPIPIDSNLTDEERQKMRQGDGSTQPESPSDWVLMGLDGLLKRIQSLSAELLRNRASMLWEALIDCVQKEGNSKFSGIYEWFYYKWKKSQFPARFVKQLNETAWIPDKSNQLRQPRTVEFASLGWEEHPFLLSQILFKKPKPQIVDTLAKEYGIETEFLDLILDVIKEHKLTPEKLPKWLGLIESRKGVGRSKDEIREEGIRRESTSQRTGLTSTEHDGTGGEPFAKLFYRVTARTSSVGPAHPVLLPEGGPFTEKSAKQHTQQSGQYGRSGVHSQKPATRWEPTEAAKALADEFKTMVHGDYGRRCQICGTTFKMKNGELQTFVVHVVEPRGDSRTNHLGDLMGLCGRHFALVRYGEWTWLNPKTGATFEDSEGLEGWEHWQRFVLNAKGTDAEKTDSDGNTFIALPIRFWNVYEKWDAEPNPIDKLVRYSKPHWKYLCELLKT